MSTVAARPGAIVTGGPEHVVGEGSPILATITYWPAGRLIE